MSSKKRGKKHEAPGWRWNTRGLCHNKGGSHANTEKLLISSIIAESDGDVKYQILLPLGAILQRQHYGAFANER